MPLKDHYLPEDHDMMADHLENLLKTSLQIQECALQANFNHNEQHLQPINDSLKILMALNAKKVQRDEMEKAEAGRGWF